MRLGQDLEETTVNLLRMGNSRGVKAARQCFPSFGTLKWGVLATVMGLCGIFSSHAKSQDSTSATRSSSGRPASAETEKLSTYTNAAWGISFQYPAKYVFEELNAPSERIPSWRLGRMFDRHPGQFLVAMVEIPKELFPGTDLTSAIFGVSANRNVAKQECWTVVVGQNDRPTHTIMLDGVEFHWSEGADAPLAAAFRDYAGFSNGVCYEIETVVATMRMGPPEGVARVDEKDLESRMDALLHSLKMVPSNPAENSPQIHSFTVEDLSSPSSPNTYRIQWQVTGATEKQVTIDLNCFADSSLMDVTEVGNGGTAFPCGELKSVATLSGSLNLKIANHTGVLVPLEIRLLALGREPVTRTVKISLPVQPVVWGKTFNGRFMGKAQISEFFPGVNSGLFGDSFSAHETVWFGTTSVSAVTRDSRHLEFTVPSSLPSGVVSLYVEDERGRSNSLTARINWIQPHIGAVNRIPALPGHDISLVPGQRVSVTGGGFTSNNTVWIGTTNVAAKSDDRFPQYGLNFSVPVSLQTGSYPLYVTNELGKTNVITAIVVEAH